MVGLFGRIMKKDVKEEELDVKKGLGLSEIITAIFHTPDGEEKFEVRDYTQNPQQLLEDLQTFSIGDSYLVKVRGVVGGLAIFEGYQNRSYGGFISLDETPIYFEKRVVRRLLGQSILEMAKSEPVEMTARLSIHDPNTGVPYILYPFILRLGDYTFPNPDEFRPGDQE